MVDELGDLKSGKMNIHRFLNMIAMKLRKKKNPLHLKSALTHLQAKKKLNRKILQVMRQCQNFKIDAFKNTKKRKKKTLKANREREKTSTKRNLKI